MADTLTAYEEFLSRKAHIPPLGGVEVDRVSAGEHLFDFQRDIVRWALRRGCAAVFAGTGLGKTLMALSWADTLVNEIDARVLIVTPLAVAQQFRAEGRKFGIHVEVARDQVDVQGPITATNYEKLHKFELEKFNAVVLDESSILKSYDGKTRTQLIAAFKDTRFKLACTATPSPNDYMELGNHAEFVGAASYMGMLSTFFVHDGGDTSKWRLKGHGEDAFWRWVSSWAVMFQNPSELGYDGRAFILPKLCEHFHTAETSDLPVGGSLLPPSLDLRGRIAARRKSVTERVQLAASLTPSSGAFVWWCNLNDESRALASVIPGAVELSGADSETAKIAKLEAFVVGKLRVLVTKPSICGHGLNWQHCHQTGFVGLTDSFEQVYQAIRRFWRFGQTQPVHTHYIVADTEGAVLDNIRRKHAEAEKMRAGMLKNMTELTRTELAVNARLDQFQGCDNYTFPEWLLK